MTVTTGTWIQDFFSSILSIKCASTTYMNPFDMLRCEIKIQVPVVTVIIAVHVIVFFYVVMYALFVLSVHVYYVNCNAKTQMQIYTCTL
jgi:hypothetical protein